MVWNWHIIFQKEFIYTTKLRMDTKNKDSIHNFLNN
jgi:hypothetical protein